MKNITHILSEEHQNILKVIESMLSECDSLEMEKSLTGTSLKELSNS